MIARDDQFVLGELTEKQQLTNADLNSLKQKLNQSILSIHWEIKSLLTLGFGLFAAGISGLIYENFEDHIKSIILAVLIISFIISAWYCFSKNEVFKWQEVTQKKAFFNAVLIFCTSLFLSLEGYILSKFSFLDENLVELTVISTIFYFFCAYYFDNIAVLTKGMIAFTACFFTINFHIYEADNFIDFFETDKIEALKENKPVYKSIAIGIFFLIMGYLSKWLKLKEHFKKTYLVFAVQLIMLVLTTKVINKHTSEPIFICLLLAFSLIFYIFSVREKNNIILFTIIVYSYIAITSFLKVGSWSDLDGGLYFIISGLLIISFFFFKRKRYEVEEPTIKKIKYIGNELYKKRLISRKVKRWIKLEYLSSEIGNGILQNNTDGRISVKPIIQTLLFALTTIVLFSTITVIYTVVPNILTFVLFLVGIALLWLYEQFLSRRFYKAGYDTSFMITGTGLIIIAIINMFQENFNSNNPVQFIICTIVAWFLAIRYKNYIIFCAGYLLFLISLISYVKQWELHSIIFLISSSLSALIGWSYFCKQRKKGNVLKYKWYKNLEVFFIAILAFTLNPYYLDLFITEKPSREWKVSLDFFHLLFINICFILTLLVLWVKQQNRIPLIVAISSLYTSFLSVWYFCGEPWGWETKTNWIITICGFSMIGFSILLYTIFKEKRWNIIATKIDHQEEDYVIFEWIEKFRKKIHLNR